MAPPFDIEWIEEPAESFLRSSGQIFAVFDASTQDSGNVSFGVRRGDRRYFVKTAGLPDDPRPVLDHDDRVSLLRNAVHLRRSCDHPALPALCHVIESPSGPLLVYEWVDGDLLRPAEHVSPRDRFRAGSLDQILAALDVIYDLHAHLAAAGWIAVDFYDGCLIYDFARKRIRIVDVDMYRRGPFVNEMGRMFGSTRFMAPEEHVRGARIDARTNVFTMGRTAAVLLSDGSLARDPFRGSDTLHQILLRACADAPEDRYPTIAAFHEAWRNTRA